MPALRTECNNPVRPGSAADLKLIAALAARIVLEELQSGSGGPNHWVWTTEPLDGYPDKVYGSVSEYTIPRHESCPVCNPLSVEPVLVADEALSVIEAEVSEAKGAETGGILMGFRLAKNGSVAITRASGPGPNAVREVDRFDRDVEYCQQVLDTATAELGIRGCYAGEWHHHPSGGSGPSGLDLLSLSTIARQDEYGVDMPVMLIVSAEGVAATVHPVNRSHVPVDHRSLSLAEILRLQPHLAQDI